MRIVVTGLDKVISDLENRKKSLAKKLKVTMERMSSIGIDTASVKFRSAQYDGVNDVSVDSAPEWTDDDTLAIVARGKAVAFIEFGTGIHYTETHPTASKVGAVRGGYGDGKGKRDSWTYYGVPGTNGTVVRESDNGTVIRTHGNPPARAMYDAGKEMREKISEIAREVFRNG